VTRRDALDATPAALAELARLRERHGPLELFQSRGCCDGSSPLCLARDELPVGAGDLLLGEIDGVPSQPHTVLRLPSVALRLEHPEESPVSASTACARSYVR